ncbi:oxytocin receptor-like [Diadema antillarum]|uniref:oxytocin receptor-like n=1 Tax=Diadema antillarum TaxID=105358 RepID=UPI003A88DE6A
MSCTGEGCHALEATYSTPSYTSPKGGADYTEWGFNDSANASSTADPTDRDEILAIWEIFSSTLILLVALFGNSIVVHSLWRRRKKLSRMHFFILHLCIADLLTAVLSIFPQLLWDITYLFYAPDFMCRLVKYGQVFPMYLSTYILVMTAIDRYIAICHPLLGLRGDYTQRMRIMIAIAYGISFVFTIPQMIIFRNVPLGSGFQCYAQFRSKWGPRIYITFFITAVYIVPSMILAGTYGLVSYTVWRNIGGTPNSELKKNNNAISNSSHVVTTNVDEEDGDHDGSEVKVTKTNNDRPDPLCRKHGSAARVSRAKVKTIKMTLAIVTVYVACWTPFGLAQLWAAWDPYAPFQGAAFTIIMLLANLNSCTNPWIYLAFSGNVKRETLQTFGCFKLVQATSGRFGKSKNGRDRSPADDNSSRYVSTTSPMGSKTLYSTVDAARDRGSGYSCNYAAPAGHTRDI